MRVQTWQHPVGQGGMTEGIVSNNGSQFHWIYDCGSNQIDCLRRCILNLKSRGNVDVLFLSHLDSDHINGVQDLLQAVDVREVVLPYFDRSYLFLLLANSAHSGGVSADYVEFLADPSGWLIARGVEVVTMIGPPDDEGSIAPDFPTPEPFGREREGRIWMKWDRQDPDRLVQGILGRTTHQIALRRSGSALLANVQGVIADWILLPFAHPIPKSKVKAFERALKQKFGSFAGRFSKSKLLEIIKSRQKIADLKECFREIWKDGNLASLSLYSGPISAASSWQGHCSFGAARTANISEDSSLLEALVQLMTRRRLDWMADPNVGWILTGDAKLTVKTRLRHFSNFYRHILGNVGVLMLPHHGAESSSDYRLPRIFSRLDLAFAAAGPNSYSHPSKELVDLFGPVFSAGFHCVNDQPSSLLHSDVKPHLSAY